MIAWWVLAWLCSPSADAGELNFAPDRPGFGDNAQLVGAGHVMIEGGALAVVNEGVAPGLADFVLRIGAIDALEVQLAFPGMALRHPRLGAGLGVKVGGPISDQWSLSGAYRGTIGAGLQVGEFFFDSDVSGNLGWADDRFGAWLHVGTTLVGGVGRFGGGASVSLDPVGLYLNAAGYTYALPRGSGGITPMVGGGAWLAVTDRFQLDTGLDAYPLSGSLVIRLGASGAF